MVETPVPADPSQLLVDDLRDAWHVLSTAERLEGFKLLPRDGAEDYFFELSPADQADIMGSLPAVERRRYFYSKYFYRVMRSAEWRMVGEFMAAGSPVAHYEFDAPPADEMAAGPGVRLAREGGTPAPAPVLNPGAYDRLEGPPMLIFPGIYTGW